MISFKTIHKDKKSRARVGELHTPHGIVETPAFVPVGTQATVKSLTPDDLKTIGVQILFGNTYHLHLRPGEETIEQFGGLGKFMNWSGVTMTDSGGFQVFSLARDKKNYQSSVVGSRKLTENQLSTDNQELRTDNQNESDFDIRNSNLVTVSEDGVIFRSHLDGSKHMFTPEQSIAIQKKIGADIVLAFDQCTTYPITHESAKTDMERTHRWALRSLEEFRRGKGKEKVPYYREGSETLSPLPLTLTPFPQSLYGIVQGSTFEDLRKESAQFIAAHDFDGFAIGGVSVGETKQEMHEAVDRSVPFLPDEKIRHLLGIGDVDDIFEIVERGIDTFDCVTPSRLGRVGHIFVHPPEGRVQNRFRYDVTKSVYAHSADPLSIGCDCYVCQNYTRGYIHHLFRAKELLAYRLATYHNIHFIINLAKAIRLSLLEDNFFYLKSRWLE